MAKEDIAVKENDEKDKEEEKAVEREIEGKDAESTSAAPMDIS